MENRKTGICGFVESWERFQISVVLNFGMKMTFTNANTQ